MPTTPYTVETFGSLNVVADPFELGATGATDMKNVDFDKRGRVRTRDGFTRVAAVSNAGGDDEGMAVFDGPGDQILVAYNNGITPTLKVYTTAGSLVTTTALGFVSPWSSAARGTASGTHYLYLADGLGTIRRWDGSSLTSPGGMPIAGFLASVPTSGRLVAAPNGSNTSQIVFSNPFAAETWDATNFVELAPGDGTITAVETWRDKLFVFKQRQFFVFTGESIDSDGGSIFNYYAVDRHGAFRTTSGDEGVYFWDGRSIWLTTGDTPTRVSTVVDPILRGDASVNSETVAAATSASHRMSYADGRLYVSMLMSGGARRTLVYDPQLNAWTYWTLSVCCANTLGGLSGTVRTYWLSTAGIEKFDGATSDNGSAISWSYTTGRYGLSDAGHVAVAPESSLVGSGTVALRLDSDVYTNQNGSATLGTAPAVAEGWPATIDQEGTWLQATLSGSGVATVSRLTHYVSSVKPTGVR